MKLEDFYPLNWLGKTVTEQRELFDQILTYFIQNELHKIYARKITQAEWMKKVPKIMNCYAHYWAYDIFQKILKFYRLKELDCNVKDLAYIDHANIVHRTYAMYDDYFERGRYNPDSRCENIYIYISAFTAY
jgi:hypothetical protein